MNHPEHPHFVDLFSSDVVDANLLIAEIDQRLEQVETNENVIERHAQIDVLLEIRDWIEEEI